MKKLFFLTRKKGGVSRSLKSKSWWLTPRGLSIPDTVRFMRNRRIYPVVNFIQKKKKKHSSLSNVSRPITVRFRWTVLRPLRGRVKED